ERLHRGEPLEPVRPCVLLREVALERVRVPLPALALLRVAPAELLAGQPAAGGQLPLRLGRQPLPGPPRVLGRVLPRDLHHRVVLLPLQVGPLPLRPPPARPGHVPPPRRGSR